jgi:hypothetical protein
MSRVMASSNVEGINLIWEEDNGDYIANVFFVKMVRDSKTGERHFSFAPARPLSESQSFSESELRTFLLANSFMKPYRPDMKVEKVYREFICDPENRTRLTACYLDESGPTQPDDDCGKVTFHREDLKCPKNVIQGPFQRKP